MSQTLVCVDANTNVPAKYATARSVNFQTHSFESDSINSF